MDQSPSLASKGPPLRQREWWIGQSMPKPRSAVPTDGPTPIAKERNQDRLVPLALPETHHPRPEHGLHTLPPCEGSPERAAEARLA
jgi:hypothetical protein